MPCEIVPLRVDFFKMAAVAMERANTICVTLGGHVYFTLVTPRGVW
jgi:hypothetical protein